MADNTTETNIIYETRLYYKYNFFSNIENKIDFWSNKRYYGILNKKCIPAYIDPQYLKSLPNPTVTKNVQKQSVLNIVTDSFKEMIDEFRRADSQQSLAKSIYNPLNIKKSTLVFNTEYTNHIRQFLNIWYEQRKNQIDNEIDNFDDFLRLFINSIGFLSSPIITQTNYLTSYLSSPLITGLCFEVSNEQHDKDSKKINTYVKDQNFEFVYNTAAKYSFMIDKNAPWRFVYNLTTNYALEKMNKYDIQDLDDLFSKYYVYPHLTEYKTIKDELTNFYNIKINKKPSLQKSSYCHDTKGLKFEKILKDDNTEKQDVFWIHLYYFLRCKEENIGMTQQQFDKDLNKLTTLYNTFGEEATLTWILNKTKKFIDGGTNPDYTQYVAVMNAKQKYASSAYTFIF